MCACAHRGLPRTFSASHLHRLRICALAAITQLPYSVLRTHSMFGLAEVKGFRDLYVEYIFNSGALQSITFFEDQEVFLGDIALYYESTDPLARA